jgi:hypothetical protein
VPRARRRVRPVRRVAEIPFNIVYEARPLTDLAGCVPPLDGDMRLQPR